ncbi:MAG TPA: diaminopimelate epimerase [Acidimicrobiales bacterium]|nr:diaminopimelate epimerase [Acidimicrobiales bacterium]
MTVRTLQKWHGAGNDFLVDVVEDGGSPWWTPARARAICHRTTGVGADGLLVATLGPVVTMLLYNADGSLAEMSGNGLRCFAAAVRRSTNATWESLDVETAAGTRRVHLSMAETSGDGSVAMGEVTFAETMDGAFGVANVGNPHVVVLDDASWSDAAREDLAAKLAAQVGGANVEFLRVLGDDRLSIRVIERGVGWTQACGTGSCAVAALARRAGLCGDAVTVENPGGTLRVTFDGDEATLSGPVQFVANVEWLAA